MRHRRVRTARSPDQPMHRTMPSGAGYALENRLVPPFTFSVDVWVENDALFALGAARAELKLLASAVAPAGLMS